MRLGERVLLDGTGSPTRLHQGPPADHRYLRVHRHVAHAPAPGRLGLHTRSRRATRECGPDELAHVCRFPGGKPVALCLSLLLRTCLPQTLMFCHTRPSFVTFSFCHTRHVFPAYLTRFSFFAGAPVAPERHPRHSARCNALRRDNSVHLHPR